MSSNNIHEQNVLLLMKKIKSQSDNVEQILREQSVKNLIVEKLDKQDVENMSDAMDSLDSILISLENFYEKLGINDHIPNLLNLHEKMTNSIDKIRIELSTVSNQMGGGFWNDLGLRTQFLSSVESATNASNKINSYATSFSLGMNNTKKLIKSLFQKRQGQFGKLSIKDALKEKKIGPDAVANNLATGYKQALGSSIFGKFKNWLSSKFTTQHDSNLWIQLEPEQMKKVALEFSRALLEVNVEKFLNAEIPNFSNDKNSVSMKQATKEIAKDIKDSPSQDRDTSVKNEKEQTFDSKEASDGIQISPSVEDKKSNTGKFHKGKTYTLDQKPVLEPENSAETETETSGIENTVKNSEENKSTKGEVKDQTEDQDVKDQKIYKKLTSLRDSLFPDGDEKEKNKKFKEVLKSIGLSESKYNKTINLLTGNRRINKNKKQESVSGVSDEEVFAKWQYLAGIK